MHLVEAESTGPVEGEDPIVTPPRPPHRRVSVSLLFTLTVLIGTVVTIYVTFPPRHHVLLNEAIALHRHPPAWDLEKPSADQLRVWELGVLGKAAPLPAGDVFASRVEVLDKPTAMINFTYQGELLTYAVQRAGSVGPDATEKTDDDLRAVSWQTGPFRYVLVGKDSTAKTWRNAISDTSSK